MWRVCEVHVCSCVFVWGEGGVHLLLFGKVLVASVHNSYTPQRIIHISGPVVGKCVFYLMSVGVHSCLPTLLTYLLAYLYTCLYAVLRGVRSCKYNSYVLIIAHLEVDGPLYCDTTTQVKTLQVASLHCCLVGTRDRWSHMIKAGVFFTNTNRKHRQGGPSQLLRKSSLTT